MDEKNINYLSFIELAMQHSGLKKNEFLANAKIHPVQYRRIQNRGTCLLKTAMRLLNANGYVCVIKYEMKPDEHTKIIDEPIENLFNRDWTTYKYLTSLNDLLWNKAKLKEKICQENNRDIRSLQNIFKRDNCDVKLIYGFAESAGYNVRFVLKKDPEAAKILLNRLDEK